MIERAKILIIEDESIVAEDLKEVLEKKGYVVPGTLSSGEEALEVVGTCHPDLILMDISLSGSLMVSRPQKESMKNTIFRLFISPVIHQKDILKAPSRLIPMDIL